MAENIKKYRTRRGWSQLILSEKLDISSNFLSEIEMGKGWVSPLTLVKLAAALEVKVFELFKPLDLDSTVPDSPEAVTTTEAVKNLKTTIEKICNEHLG